MKKFNLMVITALMVLAFGTYSNARVTSATPDERDIFCVGPSGAEVCVDASGNMIATTDDDADLGTSSLEWQDGYFDGTVYTDGISNSGDYAGTGAMTASSLDTGEGANELYDMDQNVMTTSDVTFADVNANTGSFAGNLAVSGTFNVTGTVTLVGDLSVGNDISVTSNITTGGYIALHGISTAEIVEITPTVAGLMYWWADESKPIWSVIGGFVDATATSVP